METIPAKELDRYIWDDQYLIVDVRPRIEFARGHIRGAMSAPEGRFGDRLKNRKNTTLILYCDRGARSMSVAREMEKNGWRTMTVVGGIRAYRGSNMVHGMER